MWKFRMWIIAAVLALLPLSFSVLSPVSAQEGVHADLVLFYGQGCPHCAGMIGFLEEMETKFPSLAVHGYEVYFQKENIALFQAIAKQYGGAIDAVPSVFIGEKSFVGFSRRIGEDIESAIRSCVREGCPSPLRFLPQSRSSESTGGQGMSMPGGGQEPAPRENPPVQEVAKGEVEPPVAPQIAGANAIIVPQKQEEESGEEMTGQGTRLHAEISGTELPSAITIPAVIGAAVVDAINPCEFAVLIILMTTILASGIRRRALFAGLAFSLSMYISYFLMGLGLYTAIQAAGLTHTFYATIAVLAIFIGLFNLKDYLWYGKWFLMEVPLSWRPRLKALLRGVTSVPGAFLIGFVVSLFLLPCTSGPYIVILGLLAHTTTKGNALALLAFYNIIFISPMVLITLGIYFGFTTTEQAEEWRTKKLRNLHLIAGIIILAMGLTMLGSLFLGYV